MCNGARVPVPLPLSTWFCPLAGGQLRSNHGALPALCPNLPRPQPHAQLLRSCSLPGPPGAASKPHTLSVKPERRNPSPKPREKLVNALGMETHESCLFQNLQGLATRVSIEDVRVSAVRGKSMWPLLFLCPSLNPKPLPL